MSRPAFSMADLQAAAKRLDAANVAERKGDSKPVASAVDRDALDSLENLYDKHNGDLDLIFDELKANPSKAKKPHNKPKGAKDFAEKYMQGLFSLVDEDADAKSHK